MVKAETQPDPPSRWSLEYFQRPPCISWKTAWCDPFVMVSMNQARTGHHVGVATETLHCSLFFAYLAWHQSFLCKSSCYSKDVATAARRWYWRILSTNTVEDWLWNAMWDIGLNSYFSIFPCSQWCTQEPQDLLSFQSTPFHTTIFFSIFCHLFSHTWAFLLPFLILCCF